MPMMSAMEEQRFNTQPPEGGWLYYCYIEYSKVVSTHSRPKAAGIFTDLFSRESVRFNTQPPEGGWNVVS